MGAVKKALIGLGATLAVGAGAFAVGTVTYEIYTPSTFPADTKINSVDVSKLTVEQAEEKLVSEWNKNDFVIYESDESVEQAIPENTEITSEDEKIQREIKEKKLKENKNKKVLGKISDLDLTYDIHDSVQDLIKTHFYEVVARKLNIQSRNLPLNMKVKDTGEKFNKQLTSLAVLKDPKNVKKTRNAYVNLKDSDYSIVKEVYGNNVDKNKFKTNVLKNISEGDFYINYYPQDYYEKPKVKSNSTDLQNQQEYLKGLNVMNITYKMPKKKVKVSRDRIFRMYGISNSNLSAKAKENAPLKVDAGEVKKFVKLINDKYDTVGAKRKFKSTNKGWIVVRGGDYGYDIDKKKEAKQLTADLKAQKSITRAPVYYKTGYKNAKDIGNSYVEINLSSQKLWLYKKGKLVTSFSIVSGTTSSGHGTHPGVYYIKYKARHTTLRGSNGDGTEYASPVNYWMPFNGGQGIHDANWRSSFGGTIYRYAGSHGCVNCPPSRVGAVYNNVTAGYPVVIYY